VADPWEAIDELLATRPPVHLVEGSAQDWGLGQDALAWLAEHVRPEWRTVETGCGYSTILFGLKGTDHTIVSPDPGEHDRIREWLAAHGFAGDRIAWRADFSQNVLPRLPELPLDLGLIDGAHGFPAPFLDWYYIADRLREGGYVVIDDVHLRTGGVLKDFLLAEDGRWEMEAEFEKAVAFRKRTDDPPIPATDWVGQPWMLEEPESALPRASAFRSVVRRLTRGT
jgi:predicted O-methyltransferase YrrM